MYVKYIQYILKKKINSDNLKIDRKIGGKKLYEKI